MTATVTGHIPDARARVKRGRLRESQIALALKSQHGLDLRDASDDDDKIRKIDRWLVRGGRHVPTQIKFRETGDDLLFEVFDTFNGFGHPGNKVGRDMQGEAELYAVLKRDEKTVVVVEVKEAKKVIDLMVNAVKIVGWTTQDQKVKTFRYFKNGQEVQLKLQHDPADGRWKVVAYLPVGVFEKDSEKYTVSLPRNWRD